MSSEIKCSHCGTNNLSTEPRCRLCGQSLSPSEPEERICPGCGSSETPAGHDKCISCGWDFGPSRTIQLKEETSNEECEHWSEGPAHAQRMAMVDIAGILILLAGALGIMHALLAMLPVTGSDILTHYENFIPPGKFLNGVIQDYDLLSVAMFISGALAMALSMSTFKRTRLSTAVAGAILGIVAIGFLLGAFFAVVGLIIIVASKREFLAECA